MSPYQSVLDSHLLFTFLAVAELKSISRGSRELHLSQPAVTAQIRKLESELGVALFVRSSLGMELTEQGKALLVYAREIQNNFEMLLKAMATKRTEGGTLRIGASQCVAAGILPRLITAFAKESKDVSVRVVTKSTEEVLEEVRAGRLPLALVDGFPRVGQLRLESYLVDELVPTATPSIAKKIRRPGDLESFPTVWREAGSGTRALIERALKQAGLSVLPPRFELGSIELIKQCLVQGLGIGFLPRDCLQNEFVTGKLAPITLKELWIKRRISWALPSGGLNQTTEEFYRFACREGKRLFPG